MNGVSGARVRRFRSEISAQRFVEEMQAAEETRVHWWVLKDSGRDGAYASRMVAESYKGAGSSLEMRDSLSAAKRFLGKTRIRVFKEQVPPAKAAASPSKPMAGPEQRVPVGLGRKKLSFAVWGVKGGLQPGVYRTLGEVQVAIKGGGDFEQFDNEEDAKAYSLTHDFFAVRGGSRDGIFNTFAEALAAVKAGGGEYEVFEAEDDARKFCSESAGAAAPPVLEDMFIVWAGKSTGVMSAADCMSATKGYKGASAEGPMPAAAALQRWNNQKQKPVNKSTASASEAAAASDAASAEAADVAVRDGIEQPSQKQWEQALSSAQTRVLACWLPGGKGRIAFTWAEAARGQSQANLAIHSFAAEESLFLNFVRAEQFFTQSKNPPVSIAEKLAAARAAVAKGAHTSSSAVKPAAAKSKPAATTAKAPAAASAASDGQSVGERVGSHGVVQTREMTQIRRCFVDAPKAITICPAPSEPEEDELERDLPAPGSSTYLAADVKEHVGDAAKELTLFEYFSYKKGKVKAWPLMQFCDFLAFCRQAQRMCTTSSKPVAIANSPVFTELIDIAVRVHTQMTRRNTLGRNEIRFQVRMYMHLQYASNCLVLHTGGPAMRAFAAAVDTFGVAKVPRFTASGTASGYRYQTRAKCPPVSSEGKPVVMPRSGCYRCPAPDHWASDANFHPKGEDGKRPPITAADKKGIMARVDNDSKMSAEEKRQEKAKIQEYWAKDTA